MAEAQGVAPSTDVELLPDVYIPMRDGVRLGADIFRPKGAAPLPALVMRTPYNKRGMVFLHPWSRYLAARGYVVVLQDCRGTGVSEGEYSQYWTEGTDGYDTIEWSARQPWCNGDVGIFGSSYMGNCVYLAIAEAPPHLKAAWVAEAGPNLYRDRFYRGGIPHYMESATWSLGVDPNSAIRVWEDGRVFLPDERLHLILDRIRRVPDRIRRGSNAPFAGDYLVKNFQHQTYDDHWKAIAIDAKYHRINIPVYHMGGWFDIYTQGILDAFTGVSKARGAGKQYLHMGPWFHAEIRDQYIGPMQVDWFDHWLKGKPNGVDRWPAARVFVMGDDPASDKPSSGVWREEREWPPARTQYHRLYLRRGPSGSAASRNDGRLSSEPPADQEPPDQLSHDPNDRRLPGALSFRSLFLGGNNGGTDQRPDENGGRVLTYTTDPLPQDMEVTGQVVLDLYASSTAVDTDWVVLLTDVYPDGTSLLRTDGLLKASHRDGHDRPAPLKPGEVYEFNIALWATSQVFRKGHRVRVDLANASFPKLEPNPLPAVNTIRHDRAHPSCVVLPVIPKG